MGWAQLLSWGLACPVLVFPCFIVTASSKMMWAIARRLISPKEKWVWKLDESSGYSGSSAYSRLRLVEDGTYDSIYEDFWSSKSLPSSMTTASRVSADRLPRRVNLEKRGIVMESSMCVLCGEEEELRSQVFFMCK
ncbi:hypothetical protein VNO80_06800 [Phaseolus coccineus]|uniref:Reverse transcriptase zinc-binding domain-containing protein n=1 Tax=Phaseolus coccineus TaxID=3886 RepID=A0AAN9NHI2_PHACN